MARSFARFFLFAGSVLFLGNNLFAATNCPASVPSGITSCYFADFSSGSDANAGNSESAPWQHLPGMIGCSGKCSSTTPAAGQGFILKGGVTWTNAALGWYWTWSGTGSTSSPGCTGSGCIYIGVDPSWYAGSAWARPVLNAGGKVLTGSGGNTTFYINGSYVILDNVEFTGYYWTGSPSYGSANIGLAGGDPNLDMNDQFEHLYIHGWSHGSYASGTHDDACGINGDTADVNFNANTIIEYSVISGADTDQASCNGAIFGSPPNVAYNMMEYVASCMVIDGTASVHDNICQNVVGSFEPTAHENALEINWDGQNVTIYNNVIRHLGNGALAIWCGIDFGHTCYMFNNVVYDTQPGNILDLAYSLLSSSQGGSWVLWNNTIECGPDSNPNAVCASGIPLGATSATFQNNQFITNSGSYWSGLTPILTKNILQTKSAANGQGYTSSETYAFSPSAAYPTDATPGQGSSAASFCSASGVNACNSDTTYGVAYNTTNHTVSSPGRPTNAWSSPPDVGAYSYSKAPAPPQNVQGTPQPQ